MKPDKTESAMFRAAARALRTLMPFHAHQVPYALNTSRDWSIFPVDICPEGGRFHKTLRVLNSSAQSFDILSPLGVKTRRRSRRSLDRNIHLHELNQDDFRSCVQVFDVSLDPRKLTPYSLAESVPVVALPVSQRVGLWSMLVSGKKIVFDGVTLFEHLLAVDDHAANLLLSPLMASGFRKSLTGNRFFLSGSSPVLNELVDLRAKDHLGSQFHRARCIAYWLGSEEGAAELLRCRISILDDRSQIRVPQLPVAAPVRVACVQRADHLQVIQLHPLVYGEFWPLVCEKIQLEDPSTGLGLEFDSGAAEHVRGDLAWWGPDAVSVRPITCFPYTFKRSRLTDVDTVAARVDGETRVLNPNLLGADHSEIDRRLRQRVELWQRPAAVEREGTDCRPEDYHCRHRFKVEELLQLMSVSAIRDQCHRCIPYWNAHLAICVRQLEACLAQRDGPGRTLFCWALPRVRGMSTAFPGDEAAAEQAVLEALVIDLFLAGTEPTGCNTWRHAAVPDYARGTALSPSMVDALRCLLTHSPRLFGFACDTWTWTEFAVLSKVLGVPSVSPAEVQACLKSVGPYLSPDDLARLAARALCQGQALCSAAVTAP